MARPRTRLKEIAEATGFSVNTVSLALRGSKRLPEKTREKILEEAKRQNYFPNHIARSLVSRVTQNVGLILTDILNPTITLTAHSIERLLADAGYGVMFATSDNKLENEVRAFGAFQSHQVDGILVYPTNRNQIDHILAAKNSGFPILALADMGEHDLNVVGIDNRKGAYAAVKHLISKGHRQIAILDGALDTGNTDKQEGAIAALVEGGLSADALQVVDPDGHQAVHGFNAIQKAMALNPKPTAVFATTDSLAIGAVRWCSENGISIPDDVAIVGFDNTEASEYCSVPLTTIDYATDVVSRNAVAGIINLIENGQGDSPLITNLIEPKLIVRKST
ncbi:MAG: LacI family DNA-binding transcriptional regulator [Paracoccaceae bacterium]